MIEKVGLEILILTGQINEDWDRGKQCVAYVTVMFKLPEGHVLVEITHKTY